MSKSAEVVATDWMHDAQARAALPHGARDESYALLMRRTLLDSPNEKVSKILKAQSSRVRVSGWTDFLQAADGPELLRFFAYRPEDAIGKFSLSLPETQRWSSLAEIYEACYRLCEQGAHDQSAAGGIAYAARLSAAQLARTRWVLLSQPFASEARPESSDLQQVNEEPGRLVALAQQARDDWLAVLAVIDDYPQLAARIGDLEADAAALAAIKITEKQLGLDKPDDADLADAVGREAASFAVTRLLLPRFAWAVATRSYVRQAAAWSRFFSAAACLAVVAVLVQLLISVLLPWPSGYTSAAFTALAIYPLIGLAAAAEPSATWPWLLRQPAGAAVGLLALASFGSTWWFAGSSPGQTARAVGVTGGLVAAALLYLYIEAIGHGVRGCRLLRRPPGVTLVGLMHGLLISLIGLRFLLPFFTSIPTGGAALTCWYAAAPCRSLVLPAPVLLGLAAAWSLAAGVFLQIIWDNEPVTAPLGHVSWRRGG